MKPSNTLILPTVTGRGYFCKKCQSRINRELFATPSIYSGLSSSLLAKSTGSTLPGLEKHSLRFPQNALVHRHAHCHQLVTHVSILSPQQAPASCHSRTKRHVDEYTSHHPTASHSVWHEQLPRHRLDRQHMQLPRLRSSVISAHGQLRLFLRAVGLRLRLLTVDDHALLLLHRRSARASISIARLLQVASLRWPRARTLRSLRGSLRLRRSLLR